MKPVFIACTTWVLLTGTACGGGPQKPARKKMPEFNRLGISEQFNSPGTTADWANFPFSTGEVDVQSNNTQSVFHFVALPDAGYDSLAMHIIAGRQSEAVSLLAEWARQEEKGVVIDLRSRAAETGHRTDFTLERPGEFSIPVIFLWDRSSEARAAAFIDIMHSVPAIQCRRSSGNANGQQDCFRSPAAF